MTSLRCAALAVLLWSAAAAAQSGGNLYLSQGKVFYQGLEFEKCVQRMEQATRWKDSTQKELAEIELYSGLCKFSLGQRTEADDHFALALQMDPTLQLPASTSPRIAQAFDAVASKVRPAAAARAEAQKQEESASSGTEAPRRTTLVPSTPPENTVSEAFTPQPPGPSRVLPITLGGVTVAAAIGGGILGNMAKSLEARYNDRTTFESDAVVAGRDARNAALGANIAFGLAGAAAVGAVTTLLLGM